MAAETVRERGTGLGLSCTARDGAIRIGAGGGECTREVKPPVKNGRVWRGARGYRCGETLINAIR